MAVFYQKKNLIMLDEDENSHLVILKPNQGKLDYYFLATWAQDSSAISDETRFKNF